MAALDLRCHLLCRFDVPCLRGFSAAAEQDAVAWEMNTRPRKTLDWRSPAEAFFEQYIKARDGLAPSDAYPTWNLAVKTAELVEFS